MTFSVGWLFASFVVSTSGFGFFLYGKKQNHMPALSVGLALMIFPAFVASVPWMLGIAAAILAGLWAATRSGL